MAYNREIWQDHVTEFSDRFREVVNGDGTISHIPVEGEVIQQGTPQNARHFNALQLNFRHGHVASALRVNGEIDGNPPVFQAFPAADCHPRVRTADFVLRIGNRSVRVYATGPGQRRAGIPTA